jgi:hypothetical protein
MTKNEQKNNSPRYKDGDGVEWTTVGTIKTGTVRGVIPAGDSAKDHITPLLDGTGRSYSNSLFKGSNDVATMDRYLVEVPDKKRVVYYTPHVRTADGSSGAAFRKTTK